MQEKDEARETENERLETLAEMEDIAEKKTRIYSRLLTEVALAKKMEELSLRHKQRRETLEKLLYGKCKKKKNGQGRCASKGEEEEK